MAASLVQLTPLSPSRQELLHLSVKPVNSWNTWRRIPESGGRGDSRTKGRVSIPADLRSNGSLRPRLHGLRISCFPLVLLRTSPSTRVGDPFTSSPQRTPTALRLRGWRMRRRSAFRFHSMKKEEDLRGRLLSWNHPPPPSSQTMEQNG